MKRISYSGGIISALLFLLLPTAGAKPLLTEEVQPLGFLYFEAGIAASQRLDNFGTPKTTYKTEHVPMTLNLGVSDRMDLGFTVQYLSQSLSQPNLTLKGSETADFVAHVKYSPTDYWGFMAFWYQPESQKTSDELPIGHGDDFELLTLIKLPSDFVSTHLNLGYVWREPYEGQLGVKDTPRSNINPGNIAEARLSFELPLRWDLNFLTESAYYWVENEKISRQLIEGTRGEAWDALLGLSWSHESWNLGAGVGTGLLDEKHSSFDLTRGMGNLFYKFSLSYKLKPKKPEES